MTKSVLGATIEAMNQPSTQLRFKATPVVAGLALATALTLLAGCTYLQELVGLGVRQPTVTFVDAAITRLSFTGVDLVVSLSVENPNSFDLHFAKLNYRLMAAGIAVAQGELVNRVSIPSEGRQLVKLPLTISGDQAVKLVRDLLTKPSAPTALLIANAEFDTPLGPMQVSFEDQKPLHKLTGR